MIESDYSLEAILFQIGKDFPETLDNNFRSCIEANPDYSEMNRILESLTAFIKSRTGIRLEFKLIKPNGFLSLLSTGYVTAVDIPGHNSFNALDPKAIKKMTELDLDNFEVESIVAGKIDNAKCTVSGIYSEITFTMAISVTFFDGSVKPEHITGITLHELGHCFDYCTKVGNTLITSTFAAAATGQIKDGDTIEQKVLIGNAYLKAYGLPNRVDENNADASSVVALLLAGQQLHMQNRLGRRYDPIREAERISDQFVNRWGRGRSLVEAMIQIEASKGITGKLRIKPRWMGAVGDLSWFAMFPWKSFASNYARGVQAGVSGAKMAGIIGGIAIPVKLIVGVIVTFALESLVEWMVPNANHPSLPERINYLRLDTIALLKTDPEPDIRRKALEDLEYYDQMVKETTSWTAVSKRLTQYLARVLSGRYQRNLKERTEVELINNPLHELTAVLKG